MLTALLPPVSKTAHTLPSRLTTDRAVTSSSSGLFAPESSSHMRPVLPPSLPSSARSGDVSEKEISKTRQNQRFYEQSKVY